MCAAEDCRASLRKVGQPEEVEEPGSGLVDIRTGRELPQSLMRDPEQGGPPLLMTADNSAAFVQLPGRGWAEVRKMQRTQLRSLALRDLFRCLLPADARAEPRVVPPRDEVRPAADEAELVAPLRRGAVDELLRRPGVAVPAFFLLAVGSQM